MNIVDAFVKDLAYGARILRRNPTFAITAIGTIAIGIGATSAIFSATNAVLLRPLPYRNSNRLVLAEPLSNAGFFDLREGTKADFEDMAAIMVFRAVVPREDGSAERISKGLVTTNFFRLLGARMVLGRDFTEADGQPHGPPPPPFPPPQGAVAILSYDYFQRRYAADPLILGREMIGTGGTGPRIFGVLAPGFKLFLPARRGAQPSPDVWIANDRGYDERNRSSLMLTVVGSLKPGVTLDRAQSEIRRIAAGWGPHAMQVLLVPWQKTLISEIRHSVLTLMGTATLLLLIACANVANLMLVRAAKRERELAVRAALGGTAYRLAEQMFAEALVLVGVGTLVGMGVAWIGIRAVLVLAPTNIPRLESTSIDWRVLAFAALAGTLEAVILGTLPFWRSLTPNVMRILRGGGRSLVLAGSPFLRNAVVVAEVTLAFILLIGSGLMLRSFLELRRVDPGYDPQGILTFLTVGDAQGLREAAHRIAFLRELGDRLRAIPGVQSVGAAVDLPLHGQSFGIRWGTEQEPANPNHMADLSIVLPGYFETLHSRVIEGRVFTAGDNAAGRNGAVIDQTLAAKAFPNQSALGKRICIHMPKPIWLEVVGVVAHQRLRSLAHPGPEQIYLVDGFRGIGISRHWALRNGGDPAMHATAVRAAVASFAPGRLAVTEMQTMETTIKQAQAPARFHLLLIGAFGSFAGFLAGVGVYGVLASSVRQRTAEIGVRMALGAAPADIFRLLIRQGLLLTAVGVALGLAVAFLLTGAMSTMLVGVKGTDTATFAAITAFIFVIGGVASWIPARRAAGLDPANALREEQ